MISSTRFVLLALSFLLARRAGAAGSEGEAAGAGAGSAASAAAAAAVRKRVVVDGAGEVHAHSAAAAAAASLAQSQGKAQARTVYSMLKDQLYAGRDPYSLLSSPQGKVSTDLGYMHSHLKPQLVDRVLQYTNGPSFWLEVGSFIGNSAVTTANQVKQQGLKTSIVAVDPFSGDVNMWDWNKGHTGPLAAGGHRDFDFLEMDQYGSPRIYETFLANIEARGHSDAVLPVRATSLVGMRLLTRLKQQNRLDRLPQVIYLDSAHEKDETLIELQTAWRTLDDGGVLFGDDWGWGAVKDDVSKFASSLKLDQLPQSLIKSFDIDTVTGFHRAAQPIPGVVLVDDQWLILKPKADSMETKEM